MSLYFMSIRPDAFVGMPFSASSIVSTCVPVIAKPISEYFSRCSQKCTTRESFTATSNLQISYGPMIVNKSR